MKTVYIVHGIMVAKTPSLPFVFTVLLLCQGNETYKYKGTWNQNSLITIEALFFLHSPQCSQLISVFPVLALYEILFSVFWHCVCVCVYVCVCVCVSIKSLQLCLTLCNCMDCCIWPTRPLCQWDSPGKNTEMDCHALLQGIFPT